MHTSPKITISKETTYLTEPLREDGYVDYLAAMNARYGQGVTRENNAARAYVQAFGPQFIDEPLRKETLERLELPELPEEGDYYIEFDAFREKYYPQKDLKGNHVGDKAESVVDAQLSRASERPWSEKEYPVLAAWFAANERPLEILRQGSQQSRFFFPSISPEGKWILMSNWLPNMGPSREILRLFRYRALNLLQAGELEAAWQEVLAGYRWARLYGQQPYFTIRMVAAALEGVAHLAAQAIAFSEHLTTEQAFRFLDEIDRLPDLPSLHQCSDESERLFSLDCLLYLAVKGYEPPKFIEEMKQNSILADIWDTAWEPETLRQRALKKVFEDPRIDWNEAFRYFVKIQNDCSRLWAIADYHERAQAFEKKSQEILDNYNKALKTILAENYSAEATPISLAHHAVALLKDGLSNGPISFSLEQGRVRFDLVRLALALGAYRSDHGSYPKELSVLCPKYLPEIPRDRFSGQDLIYKPENGGYLLYSVGPNGIDDLAIRTPQKKRFHLFNLIQRGIQKCLSYRKCFFA